MALLVQTPRGTVSLPPQGFFQQQPSPFQSLLSPTGLPTAPPPLQFQPRIPAPVDINSAASAVQPAPQPRNVIPQSSSRPISDLFPDESDPFDGAPISSAPVDPAAVLGTVGTFTGIPGMGVLGSLAGNAISYGGLPAGIPGTIDLGSAFLNTISPFGLFGESVHNQALPALAAINLANDEFARGNPVTPSTPVDNPLVNPAFEPFFDAPRPDEADDSGPGPGPGPGSATDNAANQGLEDEADDPDGGPDGGPDGSDGDSSYICTAAWDTGISAPATWSLNRRFGVWIRRNDPLAYEGYSVFGPWIADRIRDGKLRWIGKLKPQCWAYEMAQRSGKDTSGFPLSIKIVNRIQRATTRPLVRLLGWYVSK